LSIRRVKPESVARLRMVRSLGQKLRHFADALYKAASPTGMERQMLLATLWERCLNKETRVQTCVSI
jgi:hypothetical protein